MKSRLSFLSLFLTKLFDFIFIKNRHTRIGGGLGGGYKTSRPRPPKSVYKVKHFKKEGI